MSLAIAIHDRWGEKESLTNEIPENKFFTGGPPNDKETPFPYATVNFPGSDPTYESGEIYTEQKLIRFTIYTKTGEDAYRIGQEVEKVFDNADDLVLQAPDCMLAIYREDSVFDETELGQWFYRIDYRAILERKFIPNPV